MYVCIRMFTYSTFSSSLELCPEFGSIPNGNLDVSGYSWGDTAELLCDDGYGARRDVVLNCVAPGEWDRAPEPCHRTYT